MVRDREKRLQLAEAACRQSFVAETNRHVMTCGQACNPIDVAVAVDHITLRTAAEGLGTCWIGAFYEDEVKRILEIPPEIRVVALLPIGYPKNPAKVRKLRRPFEKIV